MNITRLTFACAAALALSAPVLADDAMTGSSAMKGGATPSFDFSAQNASGETGTVTLKPAGKDATTVTIALTGAPAAAQPAHIHVGSCAKLNPTPAYPLTSVVNGASTTTVKEPLSKLLMGGYAVNVHKSLNDIPTYVACADLGKGGMKAGAMKGDAMQGKSLSPQAASPSP